MPARLARRASFACRLSFKRDFAEKETRRFVASICQKLVTRIRFEGDLTNTGDADKYPSISYATDAMSEKIFRIRASETSKQKREDVASRMERRNSFVEDLKSKIRLIKRGKFIRVYRKTNFSRLKRAMEIQNSICCTPVFDSPVANCAKNARCCVSAKKRQK